MKKWLVAASMMTLLTSCAYSPIYNGKEPYSGSQFMLMDSPRHTMDFFIESMTEDLMVSNVAVSARTPIAITSFVDLQNMDATNWLGNSVSEGFIHQFQRRGFKVVDFKNDRIYPSDAARRLCLKPRLARSGARAANSVCVNGNHASSRRWRIG